MAVVYELMNALHEVPMILDRWGTYDNDVEKLRWYFRCFRHQQWEDEESFDKPPDLVRVFDDKLAEFENNLPRRGNGL